MPHYRKKPVVIEAITFDDLVTHGLAECTRHGHATVNGMPWSFTYKGHAITHENDQCYLIPTLEGVMQFTPEDMLITGVKGEIYPCKKDIFEATYEPFEVQAPRLAQSFGERAVGLTFNPGGNPAVDECKRLYAAIIDTQRAIWERATDPEVKRLASIAITEAQTAQMWAVKSITWKP